MSLERIVEKGGERYLHVIHPGTLEPIGELRVSTPDEVTAAVEKARRAQKDWGARTVAERVAVVRKLKDQLLARVDEVVELVHREAGKPRREALVADYLPAIDAVDYYCGVAEEVLADERIKTRTRYIALRSKLVFEPLGVVGIISPWNYPLGIPTSEAVAILLAGNGLCIKPSEHTPYTALKLKELCVAAGLPEDLVQILPGDGQTGHALATARLDMLVFTGSARTGKKVLAAAADRMMPVVLELGGNDPMVVLEDADLDNAVSGAVWGRFTNSGQTCAAVKRLYVHESVAKTFQDRLVDRVARLRVGTDEEYDAEVGPVISEPQRVLLEQQVEDAKKAGVTVATGGERVAGLKGFFYKPTVLLDAHGGMRVMCEETFGPVLSIQTFKSDDEALSLANTSSYALSASIWTRDLDHGDRLARKLEGGSVWLNNAIYTFGMSELPWGGYKESGMGRTHGAESLRDFSKVKHVNVDKLFPAHKPWWYPYPLGRASYEEYRELIRGMYGAGLGKAMSGAVKVLRGAKERSRA